MSRSKVLLAVAVLALAGCGQEPLHSEKYYETHKSALRQELASCKPVYHTADKRKLLKAYLDGNHKVRNCVYARNANSAIHPSRLW